MKTSLSDDLTNTAIWTQIQTAWVLAEQDIAMHKFSIFVEAAFVDKSFAPLKTYRDDRVAWEIAEVLALHFRELLKERVQ